MAIFMGCVYAYVILITLAGPEYLGRNFDVAHDDDMEEAIGSNPAVASAGHQTRDPERSLSLDGDEKHAGSANRKESI
jgi:SHS family lactate transporter-like MFS transporter